MTAPWMPPLPEPDGYMRHTPVWAEDSMRQAQADAARAALEQAARRIRHELTSVSASQDVKALAEWYATSLEQMAKEITP